MTRVVLSAVAFVVGMAGVGSFANGAANTLKSHGPGERGFSSFAVDPRDGKTVYAATGGGIFKTRDGGATWQAASDGLTNRRVIDVVIDQHEPTTLYAATARGVFKSTDAARSWRATGLETGAVTVAIDPRDRSTLYAAGDSNGVFKSRDGGKSWRLLFHDPQERFYALGLDPRHPTTVYAGAGSGVFKSLDGGEHFRVWGRGLFVNERGDESKHRLVEGFVTSLAINPQRSGTLYLGCDYGVFKTTNAGLSWRRASSGLIGVSRRYKPVGSLAVSPRHPETLYAGLYPGGVFKSTNGGRRWRLMGLRGKGYLLALALDPQNPQTVYAGTTGEVAGEAFKSTDGGRTWHSLPISVP